MGDGVPRGRSDPARSIATVCSVARGSGSLLGFAVALQKESISRNCFLGIRGLLRSVPASGGVCARTRCAHRVRLRTIYSRAVTDVADDGHRLCPDDYLRSTESPCETPTIE